jgi:hypothetical protein
MTTPTGPTSPTHPSASPSPTPSTAVKPGSPEQRADRIRDQVLALDVKRVADWIGALVRTIKATRTYLANNVFVLNFVV